MLPNKFPHTHFHVVVSVKKKAVSIKEGCVKKRSINSTHLELSLFRGDMYVRSLVVDGSTPASMS